MLIFWDKNIVFLANPKAGSTAIGTALEPLANLAVLRPPELKHTNLQSYVRHVAPWLGSINGQSFMTVAVMREPVQWLRSWYRFHIQDDFVEPSDSQITPTFPEFVLAYMAPDQQLFQHIGTQSGFLTFDGKVVDRIFRYEDMQDLTDFLEDELDCAILLPRINVPPSADVSLDPELEKKLRDFLAADVELYDSLKSSHK